jgi:RimJ/RimL family protein N-acetyltransferase
MADRGAAPCEELWGDPAVTALIASRGKLTDAQVGEKLRAEIERERSGGVQYWALFDHRNGEFVGCGGIRPWLYTPGEANFEVGFHLVKRCWGKGFVTEAAFGALEYAWENRRRSRIRERETVRRRDYLSRRAARAPRRRRLR